MACVGQATVSFVQPGARTAERMAYLRAKPVLTVAESIELTGFSREAILQARKAGELPSRKLGRAVRIGTADLLRWAGAEAAAS